jgi:hypothetical protein
MRRPRVSIAALMTVVLVSGLAIAALRNADELWAGLMLALTTVLLAVAILGALYRREARRAFWVGFLLFGSAYLAASLVPASRSSLPTTQLLAHAHAKLRPAPQLYAGTFWLSKGGQPAAVTLGESTIRAEKFVLSNRLDAQGDVTIEALSNGSLFLGGTLGLSGDSEHFVAVGHSLIALALAVVGGLVARAFYTSERARASESA